MRNRATEAQWDEQYTGSPFSNGSTSSKGWKVTSPQPAHCSESKLLCSQVVG
jgi:hypothetical protein